MLGYRVLFVACPCAAHLRGRRLRRFQSDVLEPVRAPRATVAARTKTNARFCKPRLNEEVAGGDVGRPSRLIAVATRRISGPRNPFEFPRSLAAALLGEHV